MKRLLSLLVCLLLAGTFSGIRAQDTIPSEHGVFTDYRDGNQYHWIRYGTQVWMTDNLAWLPSVSPPGNYSYDDKLNYVYGYDGSDPDSARESPAYARYGVLYNWYAAMNGQTSSDSVPSGIQGACPDGWHLPGKSEWKILENYLGDHGYFFQNNRYSIAKTLASNSGWATDTIPGNTGCYPQSNNGSGFNAKPAGYYGTGDEFWDQGRETTFWTATEIFSSAAFHRSITFNNDYLAEQATSKALGYSVRCVRDR
jgi:uncharacterized protein (TIGR02145 family)